MWERGARHNPASFRYRFYMDHRPILPQDPTLGFWRKSYNQYENIYFPFVVAGKQLKYIFSNNLPVNDREDLKTIAHYNDMFKNNFKYFSALATLLLSGFIFNQMNYGNKYFYRILTVAGAYYITKKMMEFSYSKYLTHITSYYYYKYEKLAVDDINEIKDNRRSFFKLDTSSYYRETAQDIRHASHHPASEGHHDHDTSTYYGPYPVKKLSIKFSIQITKNFLRFLFHFFNFSLFI